MEAMRESWSDDRLDDLNGKVDALRIEMKTEFVAVRDEIRRGFEKIDERFDKVDKRFEKVDEHFDKVDRRFEKADERFERFEVRSDERFEAMMDRLYSMQRLMIQFCGVAIAALIGLLATQI
jgi:archaellum component FlaC